MYLAACCEDDLSHSEKKQMGSLKASAKATTPQAGVSCCMSESTLDACFFSRSIPLCPSRIMVNTSIQDSHYPYPRNAGLVGFDVHMFRQSASHFKGLTCHFCAGGITEIASLREYGPEVSGMVLDFVEVWYLTLNSCGTLLLTHIVLPTQPRGKTCPLFCLNPFKLVQA